MISIRRGLVSIAAGIACLLLFAGSPFSSGAPAARTGAPTGDPRFPFESDCTQCHNEFAVNTGPGSIVISAPNVYELGVTYAFTVVVSDSDALRFGFEITAKEGSPQFSPAGTWDVVAGSGTQLVGVSRSYVTHTDAPFGTVSETFQVQWTAPAIDAGDITFYAAGNGADNTGSTSGDEIYTSSHVIRPAGSVATESEAPASEFRLTDVFPVPFTDHTTLSFQLAEPAPVSIDVYDITGREVYSAQLGNYASGAHSVRLEADKLPAGVLLFNLMAGAHSATGRLILIR